MKAFILAAGLGTRLKPLTDDRPKAMVEVAGKPMILHILQNLQRQGFSETVVNIHHHAGIFRRYLESLRLDGMSLHISDESNLLMDTGGAIKHARKLLGDEGPFLVQNVDIISNIDYMKLIRAHKAAGGLACLAVRKRPTSRSLLVDNNIQLCGWRNHETGEVITCYNADHLELAFSGVHILSPEVFDLMPEGPFSIITFYLKMASQGKVIACHLHQEDFWLDLGRISQLQEAEEAIIRMGWN
jgi:N-acetyl-alpha-D-muramate 1-phosphate uridylyltransferase